MEIPKKSLNLGKQTLIIMRKLVKKFTQSVTQSVEWEVLTEMSRPKILLGALALNITGFLFMYAIQYFILYIEYDL